MTPPSRKGERLGRYELLEFIESAAICDMYLGTDRGTHETVEIKVVNARGLSDPSGVPRLVRAANLAQKLEHPALAQVIALDADSEGVPFVVEEHVHGQPLGKLIDASAMGMPLDRVVSMLAPLVEALARCHKAGLIHGCIDRHHVVTTKTFGAPPAKLIRFGAHADAQSPGLAPELGRGAVADARSDVWAVAALLYEMLWGAPPVVEAGAVGLPAQAAGLPEPLAAVLRRCLEVAPEARPEDACALRDTLLQLRDRPAGSRGRVGSEDTRRAVGGPLASSAHTPRSASSLAIASAGSSQTLDAPRHALSDAAGARRSRRRRRGVTDPEFGLRVAMRAQRRVAKVTVFGRPATDPSLDVAAVGAAAVGAAADANAPATAEAPLMMIAAAEEPGALAAAPAYQLPKRTFSDLVAETAADAAVAAAHAFAHSPASPPPLDPAPPEVAPPAPAADPFAAFAAQAPATAPSLAAPAKLGKVRSLRAKSRGISLIKTAPKPHKAKAPAEGGRPRVARAARAKRRPVAKQPQYPMGPPPEAMLARAGLAAPDAAALDGPRQLPPAEPRRRLGQLGSSATDAIRRVGERDALRAMATELFSLLLCTLLFFGVPLLCDATHTRAALVLGERANLGLGIVAGGTVLALIQLWWLQLSTRLGALWPATTALKAVTLLVCLLTAAHFMPARSLGSIETVARSLLPWAASAFYLCLGIFGLSRARYNTGQHALLGLLLTLLYSGSLIGSLRLVGTTLDAQHETAHSLAPIDPEVARSLKARIQATRPSQRFGSANSNIEAELEALGDTTGQADSDGPPPASGSDQDELRGSERARDERNQRAAQLEQLHEQLKAIQQKQRQQQQ